MVLLLTDLSLLIEDIELVFLRDFALYELNRDPVEACFESPDLSIILAHCLLTFFLKPFFLKVLLGSLPAISGCVFCHQCRFLDSTS